MTIYSFMNKSVYEFQPTLSFRETHNFLEALAWKIHWEETIGELF